MTVIHAVLRKEVHVRWRSTMEEGNMEIPLNEVL